MCRSRQQAEVALARLRALLAELGLEPKVARTWIVHLTEGGEGLDFLGFHHMWVRAEGAWAARVSPSSLVGLRIRRCSVLATVSGNSALRFEKIRSFALMRIAGFLAKKHRRTRAIGRWVIAFVSDDQLGLIRLDGTVVAPRPFRTWRVVPNAGGERRR